MLRTVAQVFGVVIFLLGVGGLLFGEGHLLGLFNIDLVEDLVHLLSGGVLIYFGFVRNDMQMLKTLFMGLGVVYLLVGVLGFVAPMLFGLLPSGYNIADNLLHLALGVIFLAAPGVFKEATLKV